jgi:hypothetical protein
MLFQTCFSMCLGLMVFNGELAHPMMSKYRLRFTQNCRSNFMNPVELHTVELSYNIMKGSEYFVPL